MLSAAAALLGKSLYGLEHLDTGFDQQHLLFIVIEQLDPDTNFQAAESRHRSVLDALVRELPGRGSIVSAGVSMSIPLSAVGGVHAIETRYSVDSGSTIASRGLPSAILDVVSPRYFATLGIRLLKGRDFREDDVKGAPRVAVISETVARQGWPREEAIGRPLRLVYDSTPGPPKIVIGIVADIRSRDLGQRPMPAIYLPAAQSSPGAVVVVRTTGDPAAAVNPFRRILASIDPGYAMGIAVTSRQIRSVALAQPTFVTTIFLSLAAIVVLLTAIGLFGLLAFMVRLRFREIGVRLALGAPPGIVWVGIVRQGAAMAGAGCAAGLVLTIAVSGSLRPMLHDVSPVDAGTLTAVVVLLFIVAVIASHLPAVRASRIDPMCVLRSEDR